MKYLTSAILFAAADRITLFRADPNYVESKGGDGERYMCHAVANAAKDAPGKVDVGGVIEDFRDLLHSHGVTTGGNLAHTDLEGNDNPLIPYDQRDGDYPMTWGRVSQPVRFMFLEFLALSLEE